MNVLFAIWILPLLYVCMRKLFEMVISVDSVLQGWKWTGTLWSWIIGELVSLANNCYHYVEPATSVYIHIKLLFKGRVLYLNFAAYLELTPGASLLMVMTSQLRFLPIYTICTLTISNLDLLLFLLNFLLYIISIRSWFIEKTHRLRRWVLFAKSSGERVLLLTGTEDSGFQ